MSITSGRVITPDLTHGGKGGPAETRAPVEP